MKKSKKKSVSFDNKKQLNLLIQKVYSAILKLDTITLNAFLIEVEKELYSRDDFDSLDNLCTRFQILEDELVARGVDIQCLI